MKLEAKQRLVASKDAEAQALYALMQATFKKLGWKADKTTRSAMTEIRYSKTGLWDEPGYDFAWHLPSKKYGNQTRFLSMSYSEGGKYKVLADSDIVADFADHAEACEKATKLLKELKP